MNTSLSHSERGDNSARGAPDAVFVPQQLPTLQDVLLVPFALRARYSAGDRNDLRPGRECSSGAPLATASRQTAPVVAPAENGMEKAGRENEKREEVAGYGRDRPVRRIPRKIYSIIETGVA